MPPAHKERRRATTANSGELIVRAISNLSFQKASDAGRGNHLSIVICRGGCKRKDPFRSPSFVTRKIQESPHSADKAHGFIRKGCAMSWARNVPLSRKFTYA